MGERMAAQRKSVALMLLGVAVVVITSFVLEDTMGLPSSTSLRIATAAICLWFIFKLTSDYPGERWPWIGFWVALFINVALFFTPLVDRPLSRGELMIFALPDAIVVLVTRIATYKVGDVHQRAMRQQMILGLVAVTTIFVLAVWLTPTGPSSYR